MKRIVFLTLFILMFLSIFLVTGAIGVVLKQGGYMSTQYKGWKLFTNDAYGYTLRYPPTWGATTELADNGIVIFSNPLYLEERLKKPQEFVKEDYASIDTSVYAYGVTTDAGDLTKSTSIATYASALYTDLVTPGKNIRVNGWDGVEFERKRMVLKDKYPAGLKNCPDNEETCFIQKETTKQVWVPLEKGVLLIKYDYGRSYKDATGVKKTFEKVLKSLNFK